MPNVSLVQFKLYIRGQKPLCTILRQIQKGKYQFQVEALRKEFLLGRPRSNYYLDRLPTFSPSGRFQELCQLEYLIKYTKIIRTDIKLKVGEGSALRRALLRSPYVYACFLNAKGNALTVLTKVPNEAIWHWWAAKVVAQYYRDHLKRGNGIEGFGLIEQCIFSYDPQVYFNKEAPVFPYEPGPEEPMPMITNIGAALKKKSIKKN